MTKLLPARNLDELNYCIRNEKLLTDAKIDLNHSKTVTFVSLMVGNKGLPILSSEVFIE